MLEIGKNNNHSRVCPSGSEWNGPHTLEEYRERK